MSEREQSHAHTPAHPPRTRVASELGIKSVEILENGVHRLPERVDIETVKARLPIVRKIGIVTPHPLGKLDYFLIGPHPRWPSRKRVEYLLGGITSQ
jgi:hypothetical protein